MQVVLTLFDAGYLEPVGCIRVQRRLNQWCVKQVQEPLYFFKLSPASVYPCVSLRFAICPRHGAGTNKTDSYYRNGLAIAYNLAWLRQEENQYLSCPPEIAKDTHMCREALSLLP